VKRLVLLAAALPAAAVVLIAIVAAVQIATIDVASLSTRTPRRTALMRVREAEAARQHRVFRIDQRGVPYERISPTLRRAVLIAEDDAFYSHGGLDWNEIQAAARRNLEARRIVRGGSTITQQLARNLYLGGERTLTRKLKEVGLAIRLERALSKRRIFELYLNLIEWGDGVYGAEAAARRYFRVPAASLDARQAVLLAAIVINPRRFSPLDPAPRIERRARNIASRMRRRGMLTEEEYLAAIGRAPAPQEGWLRRIFGGLFGGAPDTAAAPPEKLFAPADSDTAAGAIADSTGG